MDDLMRAAPSSTPAEANRVSSPPRHAFRLGVRVAAVSGRGLTPGAGDRCPGRRGPSETGEDGAETVTGSVS